MKVVSQSQSGKTKISLFKKKKKVDFLFVCLLPEWVNDSNFDFRYDMIHYTEIILSWHFFLKKRYT